MSRQTLSRIVRLGLTNFWRNRWLTLGATLLMALTLTMISVSLLMSFIIRDTAQTIRSKIDLTIYFRDDTIKDEQITGLSSQIASQPEVTSTHFIDKTEALTIFNRLPINEDVKKPLSLNYNPLPRSIQIGTSNPDDIQSVIASIERVDTNGLICGECVSYSKNKDTVDKLVSVTRFVQRAGIALSILFGLIAIFNVFNIIRITIVSRSDEIEIMRYVGASNAFIRGPFLIEGVLYGILGTIFTTLALLLVSYILSVVFQGSNVTGAAAVLLQVDFFRYVLGYIWVLVLAQLGIGLVLGLAVSTISIRRFLKV